MRSDIYGFCMTLYEALYGERPFTATTLAALAAEKRAGRVAEPRADPGVPRKLRHAILVGLRPRPEERYASMDALPNRPTFRSGCTT